MAGFVPNVKTLSPLPILPRPQDVNVDPLSVSTAGVIQVAPVIVAAWTGAEIVKLPKLLVPVFGSLITK